MDTNKSLPLMLALMALLLGCSKSPENRLIGEWKGTDTRGKAGTIIFNKDGSANLIEGNQVVEVTWSLDASKDPMHLDFFRGKDESDGVMRMIARFIGESKLQLRKSRDVETRPANFTSSEDRNQLILERQ